MADGKVFSENEAKGVKRLLAATTNALAETLGSLVDRPVVASPKSLRVRTADEVLGEIGGHYAVTRGALDKDFAGKTLRVLFAAEDATTLAATLMMTPDEAIAERRKLGTLEGEDLEAFGEVGNILCSGIDSVLREKISRPIGLRAQDHGVIKPGYDGDDLLGDGDDPFVVMTFELRIADLQPRPGHLLVDVETAEAWNGKPFFVDPEQAVEEPEKPADGRPARRNRLLDTHDETFENIPAAPIRGELACYVTQSKIYDVVRRCCRRVGLELERGGAGEVPNPAALHGKIVLIDVPVGEDRRFDWCKRLKAYDPAIRVLLLVHMPSRSRVLQGFMARADAILSWPLTESELSQRLDQLLEAVGSSTGADGDGSTGDDDEPSREG